MMQRTVCQNLRANVLKLGLRLVSSLAQGSLAYQETMAALKQDLKTSMLQKDTVMKNTIKMVMSKIKDAEIDGSTKDEFALFQTFNKMVKQRKKTMAEYIEGKREDLASVEQQEIDAIKKYLSTLPVTSTEDVKSLLMQHLTKLKESQGNLPMGQIFKTLLPELAQQWKTSPNLIKPLVPEAYKLIFAKK